MPARPVTRAEQYETVISTDRRVHSAARKLLVLENMTVSILQSIIHLGDVAVVQRFHGGGRHAGLGLALKGGFAVIMRRRAGFWSRNVHLSRMYVSTWSLHLNVELLIAAVAAIQ